MKKTDPRAIAANRPMKPSMNILVPTALLAAFSLAAATPARAVESYDACIGTITTLPAVIATQGTWCMKQDLATSISSGNAITIANNNITINCNGFKLGGLAAGTATQAVGISAAERNNAAVRGCTVRGFRTGVRLYGNGHLIEDNRIEGNTVTAISTAGAQLVIRNNLIFDTGGSTAGPNNEAYGILAQGAADIAGNTIEGVTSSGLYAAYGIYVIGAPALVRGNSLRDVIGGGEGYAYGIVAVSNYGSIRGNDLFGVGAPASTGVACYHPTTTAVRENVIAAYDDPMGSCSQTLDNQLL